MRLRKRAKQLQQNTGKEYIGHKNVKKADKLVQPYEHNCRYECKIISEEERKEIFKDVWAPRVMEPPDFIHQFMYGNLLFQKSINP